MGYWQNIGKSIFNISKEGGDWFYQIIGGNVTWGKKTTFQEKMSAILQNPAALYIFILLPELFSLGEFELKTKDGKEVEEHPLLDFLKNPNFMQTEDQFKWDYMFWRKLGTANLYIDSKILSKGNSMYFINGDNIEWPQWFKDNGETLFLSKRSQQLMNEQKLTYRTKGQVFDFRYEKLMQFFDISNGLGNWFSSPSRVDALYKVISNSDKSLESKNINTEFLSKFIVSGKVDINDTSKMPMADDDKQSVRESMRSRENVFPTKSPVSINRFIDQSTVLESLDKAYMNDAFIIGKMLNIPKDVIEMLGDSTYENQEKARASVISYCIQADANDFCEGILKYFGLGDTYNLELVYSHLPFVQVFEKDKADTAKSKASAFSVLVNAGADQKEVADMLGMGDWLTKFREPIPKTPTTEPNKLTKVI